LNLSVNLTAVIVVDHYGRVDLATPAGLPLLAGPLGGESKQRLDPEVIAGLAARREAGTSATEPLLVDRRRWVAFAARPARP
jgi:hypothetical protein